MPAGRLLLHLPATKTSSRRFVVPVFSRDSLKFERGSRVLSSPNASQVNRGELIPTGSTESTLPTPVAVKIIPWSRSDLAWNEIELFAQLRPHPYVLKFLGIAQDQKDLLVLSGLASPQPVTEIVKPDLRWLTQTAKAMAHLHSEDVVHRDLRASHLLLSLDGRSIRVSDLDRACVLKDGDMLETGYLPDDTLAYCAPEVIAGKSHGKKIDVYSFGILMYDLCHPRTTFASQVNNMERTEFANRVLNDGFRPNWMFSDNNLKRLAERCLAFDPEDRPDFEEVAEALNRDFPVEDASTAETTKVHLSLDPSGSNNGSSDEEPELETFAKVGTSASIGHVREFMEDALAVLQTHKGELICGVFDGLKMSRTSEFAARNFALNVLEKRLTEENLPAETLLKTSLTCTDGVLKSLEPSIECGSTATVSFVSKDRVTVGWLGDSSGFLFRRHGDNFQALSLVNKHSPNRADERERIYASNGEVLRDHAVTEDGSRIAVGPWRVMAAPQNPEAPEKVAHAIAVSRALGLFDYRPAISGEPEVVSVGRVPTNDLCLVLASDGLWDLMDLPQVLRIIMKSKGDAQKAADALVKRVLDLGAHDNVSVIVVMLE